MSSLREVLNRAIAFRGNAVSPNQMMWRETYTYDANGNRASKSTPWGSIVYEYDDENRLIRKGDIVYTVGSQLSYMHAVTTSTSALGSFLEQG